MPLQNALNFPDAFLQPLFFDRQAPAAVNYGAVGAVIGYEISHSLTPKAARSIPQGGCGTGGSAPTWRLSTQPPPDSPRSTTPTNPFPDLALSGKQTLDENIADLAGLTAAYDAYRASLAGTAAHVQNDFSGDWKFFLGVAQIWASKLTEASLREQVMTAPPKGSGSLRRATSTQGTRIRCTTRRSFTSLRPSACAFGKPM